MAWRADSGQALVEFAMVLPLLLILVIGLAEFSRAWNTKQVITDAAREGLRSSVVANPGFSSGDVVGLVNQALIRATLDPARADVTVEGFRAGTGTPARIQIDYRYDFGFFGPLIGWAAEDRTLVLSTSFVMRNE
jgi:Flp pilus assembly protein TadG